MRSDATLSLREMADQDRLDSEYAARRQFQSPCSRSARHGPGEVPWSDQLLCWDCADDELDRLALALKSVTP